jgi:2-dehydropantoate 2-reductase
MNIAILGAGAMGSLFGGLLAEAGETVTLIDINAAHLDAIRSQGLRLESDQGDRQIKTLRTCRPDQAIAPPDLLIVFTKTLHSKAALEGVRAAMSERTHVLSLQNGLGNLEALQSFVPLERILLGVTTWPADLVGPGHVRSHGAGFIRMMSADGVERPVTAQVVAALAASGLHCEADGNVWAAIWEKVAFNAALNSLCAVCACSVGELAGVEDGVQLALAIVDEVLQVARASGIDVDADKCRANVLDAIDRHTDHKPSMLQDILAGRRTEVESINGAVVSKAQALGIAAPHTRTLLGLVRLKEQHAVRRRCATTKAS